MDNVRTNNGAKVYIAPSQASTPANAAAYAALTWTEIGFVRSLPEYGDEAQIIEAAVIGDGRMRKAKASRNAGNTALVVYPDPEDAGQDALIAAEATNNYYPIKIVKPDRLNATGTDGIDYFMVLVSSKREGGGENDSIATRTFNMAVTSAVTSVDPTAGA